ncbi:hypothetical protein OAL58_03860 [Verrucomicrobia bacterium]|nr:hypothetical protein [Verrucomicrobiota bacterium]
MIKNSLIVTAVVLSLLIAPGCGEKTTPPTEESTGEPVGSGAASGGATPQGPHVREDTPAAKPSPQKTSMAEVAKHLDFGGSSFSYKSNDGMGSALEGLFSIIETMIQAEGDPQAMAALKVARNVYEQSGFKAISGTGSSSFVMENGITRNARMAHYWPGKDKGFMWELIGGPEHELDGLKLMPTNTTLAMHGDLDLTAGWKWIKAFMAEQDPAMAREFNTMLTQMANENIPVDELLESLAGEVGISVVLHPTKTVKVPVGGGWKLDEQGNERFVPETITLPEPGFVLAVKVKDTLLLEMLGGMLQSQGAEATDVNGVKMLTLIPPPGEEIPFPLSPTMMKSGDYLILASTQNLAKEVLDIQVGKSKGLAGSADFLKITAGMDLKGNHLFYLSPLLKSMGLKLVEEALAKEREFKDPNKRGAMMKFINLFAGYLSHQLILVKRMPNGLLVDNRAAGEGLMAGGGGGTGTVATVGVLASMLLPALAKAKAKANAIKSVNNASTLGKGLHGYASENGGRLPPANQWCDVVLREVFTEKVFVSPQDQPTGDPRMEAGQKFSSYALNAAVAGKNLNELAHDTVLVFECPLGWNGLGGLADIQRARTGPGLYRQLSTIAVTMADGSSRQVTFWELDGLNWTGQRRR